MAHKRHTMNDLSSSMTLFSDKRDFTTDHFKWFSIKKFVYLAFTFASSSSNFDIFSKVYENVRLFDFIVCEVTIGMPYMCMDFFIKQYTRRVDFNHHLNPLLKGITYGILLQSALWTLLHAGDLADSIRFLGSSLLSEPSWTVCRNKELNISCLPSKEIIMQCREDNHNLTNFKNTPAHLNYLISFTAMEKNVLTTRFFASFVIWLFNFFCTAVMDDTLIKIFKMAFLCRFYSTLVVMILLLCFSKYNPFTYFAQILDISSPPSYTVAMDHVTYAYGIGFVGVYDFGTMSPYTMVDNAVVIFTLIFTLSAFARSLIIKILHVVLTSCVEIEISITPHYLLFAILPFSTEFFYAHKLYVVYIYVNVMLATMAYLALLTLSMSKLLHSEFRSVKNLYIVGILCFWGFVFSVPITVQSTVSKSSLQGLIYGIKVSVLYLGGFKVAIVMWMYGVGRFSTDIHYWLGFKPTKFWSMCWMFLPVVLFSFSINRIVILITQKKDIAEILAASLWIAFSALVVTIIEIKTVVKYLVRNNISKAFTSSSKYGPPDSDDRKQRRTYNETIRLRQCIHNCNVLDDSFDCNHLPLLHKTRSRLSSSSGSNPSIKNIFEAENKKRHSDIVEAFE